MIGNNYVREEKVYSCCPGEMYPSITMSLQFRNTAKFQDNTLMSPWNMWILTIRIISCVKLVSVEPRNSIKVLGDSLISHEIWHWNCFYKDWVVPYFSNKLLSFIFNIIIWIHLLSRQHFWRQNNNLDSSIVTSTLLTSSCYPKQITY